MNNDVLNFHIQIQDFSRLLIWLMLLCFLGFCITGYAMLVSSRFFLTKTGQHFSIIDFELPFSLSKFKSLIDNLTSKTKDTIRLNLQLDYYFMPFAYLLLFFAGWYVLQREQIVMQESNWYNILWVPFLAWLFDILENKMAYTSLKIFSNTTARLLFTFSMIKWLLILAYLAFITAVLTGLLPI